MGLFCVRLSSISKEAKNVSTYKGIWQQWVSELNWTCYKTFPSILSQTHLLQCHSILKICLQLNASLLKASQWTQASLLQKPALLKLSISFYHFLFQFSLYNFSTWTYSVEYNFFSSPPGALLARSCLPGSVFTISCSSFINYPKRKELEIAMFKRQR